MYKLSERLQQFVFCFRKCVCVRGLYTVAQTHTEITIFIAEEIIKDNSQKRFYLMTKLHLYFNWILITKFILQPETNMVVRANISRSWVFLNLLLLFQIVNYS